MNHYPKHQNHTEDEIVRMFCSYCRRTLLNAKIDFYREQSRYSKYEQLFSDMRETERKKLSSVSDSSIWSTTFSLCGMNIEISDPDLADALTRLKALPREIIFLYYFAGWSDKEIGQKLHIPRSTIQHRRVKSLIYLRAILEEGGEEV